MRPGTENTVTGKTDSAVRADSHPISMMRMFTIYWLPVVIYCLAIFIQSSFPASPKIPEWNGVDKLLHGLGYAFLGILFCRAFKQQFPRKSIPFILFLSIVSTGLYGLSDEIHQAFVPFRSADSLDVLADLVGGTLGVFLYHRLVSEEVD